MKDVPWPTRAGPSGRPLPSQPRAACRVQASSAARRSQLPRHFASSPKDSPGAASSVVTVYVIPYSVKCTALDSIYSVITCLSRPQASSQCGVLWCAPVPCAPVQPGLGQARASRAVCSDPSAFINTLGPSLLRFFRPSLARHRWLGQGPPRSAQGEAFRAVMNRFFALKLGVDATRCSAGGVIRWRKRCRRNWTGTRSGNGAAKQAGGDGVQRRRRLEGEGVQGVCGGGTMVGG